MIDPYAYVLFRDDGVAHEEFYIARERGTNELVGTPERSRAIEFDSSREAYEFGRENNLNWWRAGRRSGAPLR